jgi:hypothetical protein
MIERFGLIARYRPSRYYGVLAEASITFDKASSDNK